MAAVTNLAEFRQRKKAEDRFRPMTDEEWGHYLQIVGVGSVSLEERKGAADRCFQIVESLAVFEWLLKKNGGCRTFSQAVRRAQLRHELLKLASEYGFIEFSHWL